MNFRIGSSFCGLKFVDWILSVLFCLDYCADRLEPHA